MFLISPWLIVAISLITTLSALYVAWRYRRRFVPVHWSGFLAMAFGSAVIGLFYYLIATNYERSALVNASRFIFAFILLSTFLLCIGAILIRDDKG